MEYLKEGGDMMFWARNKRAEEILKEAKETNVPENNQMPEDEYVWVDGYKGMDKDMKCHDGFQYQIGGHYEIDTDPVICANGFHLCLTLYGVFDYCAPFNGNRFFKVRALVKRKYVGKYGDLTLSDGAVAYVDKLVSKQIDILEEISSEEVLEVAKEKYPYISTVDDLQDFSSYYEFLISKIKSILSENGFTQSFIDLYVEDASRDFDKSYILKRVLMVTSENISHDMAVHILMS